MIRRLNLSAHQKNGPRTRGNRIALGALVAVLGIAALGGLNTSAGQSPQTRAPGVTYGGVRNVESVWVRLDESRHVILAIEVPWDASGSRCSDRRGYSSRVFAGAEYSRAIAIREGGAFARTVVDRYQDRGIRYVETQTLKGTVADAKITGTIEGKVERTKPNGQIVRCTFGPLNWTAFD
jgi:hypothetical protein